MIETTGSCSGIENYSRYLSGRKPGEPPPTLYEYLSPAPQNDKWIAVQYLMEYSVQAEVYRVNGSINIFLSVSEL